MPPEKRVDKRITAAFLAQQGKGRPRGVPNKATAAVKDMVVQALNNKGGVKYLERQADANPTAFLSLVAKVIPTQLTGDPESPLAIADVTHDAARVAALIAELAQRSLPGGESRTVQ